MGAYLASKSEHELHQAELETAREKLRYNPEEQTVVKRLEILLEITHTETPMQDAATMGISYFLGCIITLSPYFLIPRWMPPGHTPVYASIALSLIALLALAILKTKVTRKRPILSILEMLLIGSVAAALGYLIGEVLPNHLLRGRL